MPTSKEEIKRLRTAQKKAIKDGLVSIAYNLNNQIKKLQLTDKAQQPKAKKKTKKPNKKNLLEKMKTERLLKKEEIRLEKKLINDADYRFGKFIRERDRRKDCVTSELETCEHKIQNCCHRISRGRYSHRWDEENCAGGCVSCNKYHAQDHWACRERNEIREIGMERVDHQNLIKHKRKPSIEELLQIIEKYKRKYKDICQ